jgi:hypothetical protein
MMSHAKITKGIDNIPMNTCVSCHRYPAAVIRFAAIVLAVSAAIPVFADPEAANAANPAVNAPAARPDFEHLLEQRDFGTFMMYKRLSTESRDEVFLSYSQGATLDQIKAAVLNAFLHRQ